MELKIKKGDKYIVPMMEITDTPEDYEYDVYIRVHDFGFSVPRTLFRKCRKVLGLLGDEGLEAQVDMKVWDAMLGDGVIESIQGRTRPVYVSFDRGAHLWFGVLGNAGEDDNRTLYVTEMPEEPKGWVWVWDSRFQKPFTSDVPLTKSDAGKKYGDKLITWRQESEINK